MTPSHMFRCISTLINRSAVRVVTNTPSMASHVHALKDFSSCEIADAMIKLKVPHGGHIPDVDMYSPRRLQRGIRICGEAFCVQMVHGNDTLCPKPEQHFVDAAVEGSIMVIACPPGVKSAAWGGLMTARAQFRQVQGVIIDGRCRDLAEHQDAGFPVFARGHSILGQSPFTRPSTLDQPVTITPHEDTSFPAITIRPRDVIVADMDGVVVVPPEHTDQVAELCERGRQVDAKCMDDLKRGRSVQETFAEHRGK